MIARGDKITKDDRLKFENRRTKEKRNKRAAVDTYTKHVTIHSLRPVIAKILYLDIIIIFCSYIIMI